VYRNDSTNNGALMSHLDRWAREDARIDPDPSFFNCRFYDQCNASAGGQFCSGKYSSMSYVGREFGTGFRLAIVGYDHGETYGHNFAQARSGIVNYYQNGGEDFNQHYKGVLETAAAVFGSEADYCGRMCKRSCQKSRDPQSSCIIDRIAQPNIVKCVPETQTNRTSLATTVMRVNCAHHLIAELKILQPQLIIFHGAESKWPTIHAIEESRDILNAIEDMKDGKGHHVIYEWLTLHAYILFLHHPTRGGLKRQWDTVVVPALSYLRAQGCIPT
jgi:hypothetical protein